MEDTDDPVIKVITTEDHSTASVVITFPFVDQAYSFRDICFTILNKAKIKSDSLNEINA